MNQEVISPADTFVARQAILDRRQQVAAYELLFRTSPTSPGFDSMDGRQATSQVIANCLFTIGWEKIATGKRAFINFPRELLVNDYAEILPRQTTVIEILETVAPDSEVIETCRKLKDRGYTLALDDFVFDGRLDPLIPFVDIIKVDFRATDEKIQQDAVQRFARRGIQMLAEKIETAEEYEQARKMGYTYFQGYFYEHPVTVSGRQLPAFKIHYQSLLRQIQRPEMDYREIEQLITQEISLVYKLLRYINSARFGWYSRVSSIQHALALLGDEEIRKWASLAILSKLAEDKPRELIVTAMTRARFCEQCGPMLGLNGRKSDLFLMGMFSLLDAILDQKLDVALRDLHLPDDVSEALLRKAPDDNRLAAVYDLARAYEKAEWNAVSSTASRMGIPEDGIPPLYFESVAWSDQIFQV